MTGRRAACAVCLALMMTLTAGCGGETQATGAAEDHADEMREARSDVATGSEYVQGVTETEIIVGNTAATTGALAGAGIPFNAGLNAALEAYNRAGGFQGRAVRLINRSDGYDGANALACTRTLVEEDGVFALVGQFGAPAVDATLEYIKDQGIPLVYAAAGNSQLYQTQASDYDGVVFPVQPVYETEGRALLARALADPRGGYGLGGSRVGVIASTSDDGRGLKDGVELQAGETGTEVVCQEVEAASGCAAAVEALKEAGCDVVILCCGRSVLEEIMSAMRDADYDAKCITASSNASGRAMGQLVENGCVTAARPLYALNWLDTSDEAGLSACLEFMVVQMTWEAENGIAASDSYVGNPYTMAGYIAGTVFTGGLKNLEELGLELTWKNFVRAMETEVDIPMAGRVDFTGRQRCGLSALALNTVDPEIDENGNHELLTVSPIMSLEEVLAHIT